MKGMMTFFAGILLLGCATSATVDTKAAESWLLADMKGAAIDVTGVWDAGAYWHQGWGEARLYQEGNKVMGTLGMYGFRGIVNGKEMKALIHSDGRVYYTVVLQQTGDGSLAGRAVYGSLPPREPFPEHAYPLIMKRIQETKKEK